MVGVQRKLLERHRDYAAERRRQEEKRRREAAEALPDMLRDFLEYLEPGSIPAVPIRRLWALRHSVAAGISQQATLRHIDDILEEAKRDAAKKAEHNKDQPQLQPGGVQESGQSVR